MGNTTQIFIGMFLFLQRKIIRRQIVDFNIFGHDFVFLTAAFGLDQSAGNRQRGAGCQLFYLIIIGQVVIGDNLNVFEA